MSYIPLNIISAYSLLESTVTVKQLVSKAKEFGYSSMALTDNNVMHGAVEFYLEAKKQGIKPIIGMTVEIYEDETNEKGLSTVLLAENAEGYQNLLSLSSKIKGEHERVTADTLKTHGSHLTAIVNFQSLVAHLSNKESRLSERLERISREISHTFLGVSYDGENIEAVKNIIKLSEETAIPNVVSEPVKSLEAKDYLSLKVLDAIKNQTTLDSDEQPGERPFFFLQEPRNVVGKYKQISLGDALDSTVRIAESIDLNLSWESVLPRFDTPDGKTSPHYLREIVYSHLEKKLPGHSEIYDHRIEKELDVIIKMGFADYFLIVWDLMKYAHSKAIVTGAGRGSAAGSLVSYVLNITDVDPVAYDLLFDRFLNEERYTMPDIDLDFPDDKRDSILKYVLRKYGREHVAQIATFGTFAAKMAVRDTGRVFGLSADELKKWSDAIPSSLGITLKKAYRESETLRNLVNVSDAHKALFKTALNLEGLPRHVSTHAAGVVISRDPLVQTAPLMEGNGAMPLTQYTMNDVETVGLLKMDFLGLKNLSILADCLKNVPELRGSVKDKLAAIPLDDQKTLELFRRGDTNGIFQFESRGIRNVLRKLKPTDFEDIVAVNALYRPGPMEQIDVYIRRKNGQEKIEYIHEDLQEILEVTNGVMIYQEQVMKVASKIAGYSLSEADILRRAISKKIKTEIDAGRKQFVAGAKRRGYSEDSANRIYAHIERFADYGFNRSHAVSYSKLAFQLAYFKANFPAAFFVSLMRASANNKDKLNTYLLEAKQRHIELVHPDINQSGDNFKAENGKICFGLNAIKGMRKDFVQHILFVRRKHGGFRDLLSFINHIDKRWRKEQYVLPLIYAGSFDNLQYNRRTLVESLESILNSVNMSNGNIELFESLAPKIQVKEEYTLEERLKQEFEVTGVYLSGHPTDKFMDTRDSKQMIYITDSVQNKSQTYIVSIQEIKKIQTKRGEPMAFLEVTDASGEATCVLFPDIYRRYSKVLQKNRIFSVKGKAEFKKNKWNILVSQMQDPETLSKRVQKHLYLRFEKLDQQREVFSKILEILEKDQGDTEVIIYDQSMDRKEKLKPRYKFNSHTTSIDALKGFLGENNVIFK
ncbi:DNA polymerase-3 subunit alpha [Alkalibacterium subtropicum]|uniref:DNA polymerase III subunit alpha n=1 Tax=Alkalibacterium subtropicum TaxID=753702 RepID=A0A1I1ELE5_9LACT|nr:DNA polymerase III subunit alpha [Alkalibacterium subtropicum]SFB87911.1 DNA polymerase-3 subunit alpha [Alkalibacterium subtropicum]